MLLLAFRIYMCSRRLARDSCYSDAVYTQCGVLPGCAMAMFALQCIMLAPFDHITHCTMDIPRSLDGDADDITVHIDGMFRHIGSWSQRVLRLLVHVLKALGLPPAAHKMKLTSSIPALGKH
eukprot:8446078-Pyramimonas_sp.AAC.1